MSYDIVMQEHRKYQASVEEAQCIFEHMKIA
jgi:hypothetical protein